MPHPILLLLLLSLGFPVPLPAGAATVLYVKPTEFTPCPGEPCHTLDEYAQNASQYFVSDTTVEFLPGTHNLSQPLYVSGVNNLSLVARNATRNETVIQLSEALWFTNVSNLTLMGSTVLWYKKGTLLGFEYVLHLKVSNVIFQSMSSTVTGSSPGVFVRNVLGSSTFEQIDFVSFLQQNKYLAILKVQYDAHGLYTQRSSLRIRDSFFLEGIQLIFSHSASYIHVIS